MVAFPENINMQIELTVTQERSLSYMTEPLRLPVGIDDFEKIRKSDFYYGLFNGLYITGNQKLCEEYMG